MLFLIKKYKNKKLEKAKNFFKGIKWDPSSKTLFWRRMGLHMHFYWPHLNGIADPAMLYSSRHWKSQNVLVSHAQPTIHVGG